MSLTGSYQIGYIIKQQVYEYSMHVGVVSCLLYLVAILQVPVHPQPAKVMTDACGPEQVHATSFPSMRVYEEPESYNTCVVYQLKLDNTMKCAERVL